MLQPCNITCEKLLQLLSSRLQESPHPTPPQQNSQFDATNFKILTIPLLVSRHAEARGYLVEKIFEYVCGSLQEE